MARRHDSLIPLSHQHQHALALAVTIRRRFGLKSDSASWQNTMAEKVAESYGAELRGHFEVEEDILFPEMERYLGKLELSQELLQDHVKLREYVKSIEPEPRLTANVPQPANVGLLLDEFSNLLERHVRKEERRLFAEFEAKMPDEEALRVGREIESRLVKACPGFRRPDES